MDNSWIKLYRKTNTNGLLKDHKAWAVFSWLLINVDREGKRSFGRYQICDELNINPNTIYKIIKRLEKKWGVIQVSTTNKVTSVLVVNWDKYQHSNSIHGNEMTIKGNEATDHGIVNGNDETSNDTAGNTKQEYKNIRKERIDKSIGINAEKGKDAKAYGEPEIDVILNEFKVRRGQIPSDRKPRQVAQNIRQLIHSFIKQEGELFQKLRGQPMTFDYVHSKSWEWFMEKDYSSTTEKLETFKLKMKVYLNQVSEKLQAEKEAREQARN